jgi:hypothetical protein
MPKAVMSVWSNPSDPSREDEFNKWYNEVHAVDVLKLDPFKSVQRYKVSDAQFGPVETPGSFLAVYEVETDDLSAIPQIMADAFTSGALPLSDVIAPGPIVILEPVTERITL